MNEFLKSILDGLHTFIPSYGWCVVAFTILVRLCLMPLDYKSRVGMRKISKLAPKQAALQKKYEKDPEKYQRKLAELYQKERVSPMSSCWPMLVSMPILFAMFTAMRMMANEQLAQQAFDILLNGQPTMEPFLWIKNLWMPDSPFNAAWPSVDSLKLVESAQWISSLHNLDLAELIDLSAILNANLGAVTLPDAASLQLYAEGMDLAGMVQVNGPALLELAEIAKVDLSALSIGADSIVVMSETAYNTMLAGVHSAIEPLFSTDKTVLTNTITALTEQMRAMPEYIAQTSQRQGWTINLLVAQWTVSTDWNGLFLLPLMSAGSQYLMTVLNPATANQPAAKDGQQQPQTGNFMKWFFPVFSLMLCSSYNAAFATYWVTSNLIAMAQNLLINKYLDHKDAVAAANADTETV